MARPLRIEYEGALYHVMNRGINHQDIFLTNTHREIFLELLKEITVKFFLEIHSFCLMNNHYHLLIRTPIPNLGKAMRHLDGLYTRRFNISEGRDGSIFKGRYKAILIEDETYLLHASRYIHLNPVEAKICSNPADYPWSSYIYFSNKKIKSDWVNTDLILSHFGSHDQNNQYQEYIKQGIDEATRMSYEKSSPIFGSKHFTKEIINSMTAKQKIFSAPDIRKSKSLPTIQQISNSVAQYFSVNLDDLKSSVKGKNNLARNTAIFLSRRLGLCSHQELSNYFTNIKTASISTFIKRFEDSYTSSLAVKSHLDKIIQLVDEQVVL